jgi:hypothetical protein
MKTNIDHFVALLLRTHHRKVVDAIAEKQGLSAACQGVMLLEVTRAANQIHNPMVRHMIKTVTNLATWDKVAVFYKKLEDKEKNNA